MKKTAVPVEKKNIETQKKVYDIKKSKLEIYQELVIGEKGFFKLLKYELITTFCSWIPGALGLLIRSKLYPFLLEAVGKNVLFGTNVVLRQPKKIRIGNNVVIDDNTVLDAKGESNKGIDMGDGVFISRNTVLTCQNGDIVLGDNVNVSYNCLIFSANHVELKKNILVAAFCHIVGGSHDNDDINIPIIFQGRSAIGILLEENIWMGTGVTILDGSKVGRDSIIGAHAVVNGDIAPYSIAVGAPAKTIRDRRDDEKNSKEKQEEK